MTEIVIPRSYYLAHPLSSRKEVREWELGFEERTGINLHNPFYDINRPDIRDLDLGIVNPRKKDHVAVVEDDLTGLKAHDGLFCYLDGSETIGTYQEMIYAKIYGKTIHTVVAARDETKRNWLMNHAWIKYHSSVILPSLSDFESLVMATQAEGS